MAKGIDEQTTTERYETYKRWGEETFAKHEIAYMGEGSHLPDKSRIQVYRCARPDDFNMSFTTYFLPHGIHIDGDARPIDIRSGSLPWLLNSVHSMDYILSKMPPIYREQREFVPADVDMWLGTEFGHCEPGDDERYKEINILNDEWKEIKTWKEGEDLKNSWMSFYYDTTGDWESMDFWMDWNSHIHWGYQELLAFCRIYRLTWP